MQNLFVDENDEFVIRFSVATDKIGTIFCDLNREILEKGLEAIEAKPEDFEIKDYSATFKKPSFGDISNLSETMFITKDGDSIGFNPIVARYNKIVVLIKSWDLTGEKIKPTEADIKKLHPVIANAMGIQIELQIGDIMG